MQLSMVTEHGQDARPDAGRQVLVFHIGLPKTGSTSIQHALVALADDLAARGVHVPYDRGFYGAQFPKPGAPRGAPQADGFAYFFDVVNRRPDLRVDWPGAVEGFLSDAQARSLVISHENMSQVGAKLRREVLAPLGAHADIRFLVYLRSPLSYLSSYCLQLVYGPGPSVPRPAMQPVSRYLSSGFAGFLAPFAEFGAVDARNFDRLRKDGHLLGDFFAAIGAGDMGPETARLESQNTFRARFSLACVFMALKQVRTPSPKDWFALRRILTTAGEAIEDPLETSFLPASLAETINARWAADREVLLRRYGVAFDEGPDFNPGPEVLSFSAQYAARLQEAVAPELSDTQKAWLGQALTYADQDLEQDLNREKQSLISIKTPKTPKKGDVIMSEETKAKPEISHKDAVALAKAMFRVQNRKSGGDADKGSDKSADKAAFKAAFKAAKPEMMLKARRTLKLLHNQGYRLTKAEG